MLDLYSGDLEKCTAADIEDFLALTEPEEQRPTEGPTLDFKLELPDDIGDDIAALSNTYGGLIVVGVKTDKKLGRGNIPVAFPGCTFKISDVRAHVTNKILSTVRPRPSFEMAVVSVGSAGAVAIVIRVREGTSCPYEFERGSCLRIPVRVQDSNRQATLRQIEALIKKREGFGKPVDAPFQNLDQLGFAAQVDPPAGPPESNYVQILAAPRGDVELRLDRQQDRAIEDWIRSAFMVPRADAELRRGQFYQAEIYRRYKEDPVRHQVWRVWANGAVGFTAGLSPATPYPIGLLCADFLFFCHMVWKTLQDRKYYGAVVLRSKLVCPSKGFSPQFPNSVQGLRVLDQIPGLLSIGEERPAWCLPESLVFEECDAAVLQEPAEIIASVVQYQIRETWGAAIDHERLLDEVKKHARALR